MQDKNTTCTHKDPKVEQNKLENGCVKRRDGFENYNQEIFDQITPPIVWSENGEIWCKKISTKPSSRKDVLQLKNDLRLQIDYWQAKPRGLCRIRRALYSSCFNEIIRQVCANSLDQAILLLRIREEFNISEKAYRRIFEDGLMFSLRKTQQAKQGTSDLYDEITSLEKESNNLKKNLAKAKTKLSLTTVNIQRESMDRAKEYKKELNFFNNNYLVLKEQLDLLVPTKK
ncbi:axonemal dynein light intermediate polypeptide 1-like [Daktulosphaira vitifoliae]|uniref:axonemal dynein light intermediate polypeptide 1-like n=1 Tax=Daktulosphaira vitifoliae TaxID=58002 RepID=UPI0021AAAAC4|nr:axonemal dynein light intermediate polypeptide 1-like [Daktulosphaira vitifoliae]